jgi:hypothetical protein
MLHPLLNKIWENKNVPYDWKKGHQVKLPKKEDLSSCNNWRGIMLLFIPRKVLARIILKRLEDCIGQDTGRSRQGSAKTDPALTTQ